MAFVLTLAGHILKLERYRDWHGPCTRITRKFMKGSMFLKKGIYVYVQLIHFVVQYKLTLNYLN